MKGSTTIEPTHVFQKEKKRDRKIASSEIINPHDYLSCKLARHDSVPQVTIENEEKEKIPQSNSYQSLVLNRQTSLQQGRMRGSLIQNRQLDRIDELQSSQKESTHPDQESERSNEPIAENVVMVEDDPQGKMKDRKYSYFTQQFISSKSKKQK